MKIKITIGMCILILILITGCYQKAELKDLVDVLKQNSDFQDFNSDFKLAYERDFEPVEVEVIQLDKTVIEQRKNQFQNNLTKKQFAVIYEELPEKNSLYEVWLKDSSVENRRIISIIDMQQKKVLKFYALIHLTQEIGMVEKTNI